MIQIGTSGTRFIFKALGVAEPFDFLGDKLKFEKRKDKLFFSTLVRDRNGNLLVEIKDNKWRTSASCWDKNYTRDSLEVFGWTGQSCSTSKIVYQRDTNSG